MLTVTEIAAAATRPATWQEARALCNRILGAYLDGQGIERLPARMSPIRYSDGTTEARISGREIVVVRKGEWTARGDVSLGERVTLAEVRA